VKNGDDEPRLLRFFLAFVVEVDDDDDDDAALANETRNRTSSAKRMTFPHLNRRCRCLKDEAREEEPREHFSISKSGPLCLQIQMKKRERVSFFSFVCFFFHFFYKKKKSFTSSSKSAPGTRRCRSSRP
jgi:hypothetical protein